MTALAIEIGGSPPARRGDFMQTFSGGRIWPLDPRPEEIDITDVAHHLGKICRYGGACLRFYSVAEHCVLMAREAKRLGLPHGLRLQMLIHDAPEYILGDMVRPIKKHMPEYKPAETRLLRCMCGRFNVGYPLDPMVKQFDEAIGLTERAQNMAVPNFAWGVNFEADKPLPVRLQMWSPDRAPHEFLLEWYEAGGTR